jgi:hypothetical protein
MAKATARSIFGGFGAHKRGRRNTISIGLRPVSPRDFKIFERLKMPHTQRALWGHREKMAINALLYAAGYSINRVLYDVLGGASRGGQHGVAIPYPSVALATMSYRKKTSNPDAFFDTGALRRSLKVEVPKTGRPRLIVDFSGDPGSSQTGSKKYSRSAGVVAALLERGHTTTVTKQMRKFFMKMQLKNRGVIIGAPAVGSTIVVRGRPFFRESVDAGMRDFAERYTQTGAAARLLTQVYFGPQGPVPSYGAGPGGVSAAIGGEET